MTTLIVYGLGTLLRGAAVFLLAAILLRIFRLPLQSPRAAVFWYGALVLTAAPLPSLTTAPRLTETVETILRPTPEPLFMPTTTATQPEMLQTQPAATIDTETGLRPLSVAADCVAALWAAATALLLLG